MPDKTTLKKLREEILLLEHNQGITLKQFIEKVMKASNYKNHKVHSHLTELLHTVNTDDMPDPENFNDTRKKLVYLIDALINSHS